MLIQAVTEAIRNTPLPQMIAGGAFIAVGLAGYLWRQKKARPTTKLGAAIMFGLLFTGAYLLGAHAILDPLVDKIIGALRGS